MSNITIDDGLVQDIGGHSRWFQPLTGQEGAEIVILERRGRGDRYYRSLFPGESLDLNERVFGKFKAFRVDTRQREIKIPNKSLLGDNTELSLEVAVYYQVIDARVVALEVVDALGQLRDRIISVIRKRLSQTGLGDFDEAELEVSITSLGVQNDLGIVVNNATIIEIIYPTKRQLRDLSIINQAGRTLPILSIDKDVTVSELITAYFEKLNLPADTTASFTRKLTRQKLSSDKTLEELGINDGEVFIVDIELKAEGASQTLIRSDLDIFAVAASSSYVDTVCPVCRLHFKVGDTIQVCPNCNTGYHGSCIEFIDNRCSVCGTEFTLSISLLVRALIDAWTEAANDAKKSVRYCDKSFIEHSIRLANDFCDRLELPPFTKIKQGEFNYKRYFVLTVRFPTIFDGLRLPAEVPLIFFQGNKLLDTDIISLRHLLFEHIDSDAHFALLFIFNERNLEQIRYALKERIQVTTKAVRQRE